MIDKLEGRVPAVVPFRKPFSEFVDASRRGVRVEGFRPRNPQYLMSGDLRPYGVEAMIHLVSKHDRLGAHKLELLETGGQTYDQMLSTIATVLDTDPYDLETMRMDCCVDIDGVPVSWYRDNVRVRFKRKSRQYADWYGLEYSEIADREVETCYFGKKPNCLRIYNKSAELWARYLKSYGSIVRKAHGRDPGRTNAELLGFDGIHVRFRDEELNWVEMGIPSPEEEFGFDLRTVRTRVERQISARRVPVELDRMWKLQKRLPEFNPFEEVRVLGAALDLSLCDLSDLSYADEAKAWYTRFLIERDGYQTAYRYVNFRSGRNGLRLLERLRERVGPVDGPGVSAEQLYEKFRESVSAQLAAYCRDLV
jgi:hypothetical protein